MCAVPRPVRIVSLPHLFVHRAVRCAMGSVAVTFRIMPEDADTDLDSIRTLVRSTLGSTLRDLREQPVAFGLRAILAVVIVGCLRRLRPARAVLGRNPWSGER